MSSASVSPTAHYTGYIWSRNGLSHPALSTPEGRLLYYGAQPAVIAARIVSGTTLEDFLLARHRLIDRLLGDAIDAGRVTQVLEIAAGMSPRGWRFAQRYGDRITYVEADLPGMAERKRAALEQMDTLSDRHRVADIDALSDSGPTSLGAIAEQFDRDEGLAIITEGLLAYLDDAAIRGLWQRIAATLTSFHAGVYLADLHLRDENRLPLAAAFTWSLSAFVRGRVRLHFEDEDEAAGALREAGFTAATLHRPPESAVVRVIDASA